MAYQVGAKNRIKHENPGDAGRYCRGKVREKKVLRGREYSKVIGNHHAKVAESANRVLKKIPEEKNCVIIRELEIGKNSEPVLVAWTLALPFSLIIVGGEK